MYIPIVFYHINNSWYLPYSVFQVKNTNKLSQIYLLGDNNTKHFSKIIHHINVKKYENSVKYLRQIYKHKSQFGKSYELPCIERWFVLRAFMEDYGLKKCVYLDSDVMVYWNLSEQINLFPKHDMTWLGYSAHVNFISDINALKNFCNNILDEYNGNFPKELLKKSQFYNRFNSFESGNISDMTFFYDYNLRYKNSLLNINLPNKLGTYDDSFGYSTLYVSNDCGHKKIFWKDNLTYCKLKTTSELIPFITLHFAHNHIKKYIKHYFKYNNLKFKLFLIYNYLIILFMKIKQKLKI